MGDPIEEAFRAAPEFTALHLEVDAAIVRHVTKAAIRVAHDLVAAEREKGDGRLAALEREARADHASTWREATERCIAIVDELRQAWAHPLSGDYAKRDAADAIRVRLRSQLSPPTKCRACNGSGSLFSFAPHTGTITSTTPCDECDGSGELSPPTTPESEKP